MRLRRDSNFGGVEDILPVRKNIGFSKTMQMYMDGTFAVGSIRKLGISPSFAASAAASAAARGNEQGSEGAQQVLIELTEQPQALSEQETEATHQLDIPLEVPKSS